MYLTHVDLNLSCTWDDMYFRTYLLLQSALTVSYATNAVFKVLLHKHLHVFITWFPTYRNTWISIIGKQAYLISVGTDWLTPIDGVLKNKLNYEFQI